MRRPEIRDACCWGVGCLILVLAGLSQGSYNGRWSRSADLTEAVGRLDRLPIRLGSWTGRDEGTDQLGFHRAGILGGRLLTYTDDVSQTSVRVLLVCGRPGPIAVHTPDVCYQGAGYVLSAPPSLVTPALVAAEADRVDSAVPDRLQIYWSWNTAGRWDAPANPRFTFRGQPYLYKLYVIRSVARDGEPLNSGPAIELARALIGSFAVDPESPQTIPPKPAEAANLPSRPEPATHRARS